MLTVENLSVRRGQVQTLRDVSLHVDEGEIVSLVGSNGAGKSTVLYAVAGMLSGDGTITYRDQSILGIAPEKVTRLGIGLVPEGRQIFGELSVFDNLMMGTYSQCSRRWQDLLSDTHRIERKPAVQKQLAMVYELFPVLRERTSQAGGSLSGGEQQMLAIGRTLMADPDLLLVDELSIGLAPNLVRQLLGLLAELRDRGLTILLVEQDAKAALRIADRGYVMETGRIVTEGSAGELLGSDRIQKAVLGLNCISPPARFSIRPDPAAQHRGVQSMIWDQKHETMSRTELQELQLQRLKEQVATVYDKVPFYRQAIMAKGCTPDSIRSLADLPKLPFTIKRDFRDNYPLGLAAVPRREIVRLHASSGTTGKPTVVPYTAGDIELWTEVMARTLSTAGVTKDDVVQNAYGYGLFTGGLGFHYGAERVGATVLPVSGGQTKRQIMLLQDLGSTVLCCTPSYALYVAEVAEEMGVDLHNTNLRIGIFGAEPWSHEMRHELEAKTGLLAIDIYGLSEVIGPGVSVECEHQNGLHLFEDHFLPEIVNPATGEPLPYGERGELVITTLTKKALPVIRYRTGDITTLHPEKCACGRTLVRMDKISGRTDDMLIVRGVNVFPSQIETVLAAGGRRAAALPDHCGPPRLTRRSRGMGGGFRRDLRGRDPAHGRAGEKTAHRDSGHAGDFRERQAGGAPHDPTQRRQGAAGHRPATGVYELAHNGAQVSGLMPDSWRMTRNTRMNITQISVFLENRPGRLAHLLDVLSDAGVNLRALAVADTADFGIRAHHRRRR